LAAALEQRAKHDWRNNMASAKRNTNETFSAYRARLTAQAEVDKERSKGRVIWASSQRGTYVRAKHGAIGG
jgi:hypothetical protein